MGRSILPTLFPSPLSPCFSLFVPCPFPAPVPFPAFPSLPTPLSSPSLAPGARRQRQASASGPKRLPATAWKQCCLGGQEVESPKDGGILYTGVTRRPMAFPVGFRDLSKTTKIDAEEQTALSGTLLVCMSRNSSLPRRSRPPNPKTIAAGYS